MTVNLDSNVDGFLDMDRGGLGINTTPSSEFSFLASTSADKWGLKTRSEVQDILSIPRCVGVSAGTINEFILSPSPAIASYIDGQILVWKATLANDGPCTVNAGPGAIPLLSSAFADLLSGDISEGALLVTVYNAAGNCQVIQGFVPSQVPTSSNTFGFANYRNWRCNAIGVNNYDIDCDADAVQLTDSGNRVYVAANVDFTINMNGTVGGQLSISTVRTADTWYYPWLWYNTVMGFTGVMDPSPATPTPPTGYAGTDFKARMPGEKRTDSSVDSYVKPCICRGDLSFYRRTDGSNLTEYPPLATAGFGSVDESGQVSAWAQTNYTAMVPPTAASVKIIGQDFYASSVNDLTPNNYELTGDGFLYPVSPTYIYFCYYGALAAKAPRLFGWTSR